MSTSATVTDASVARRISRAASAGVAAGAAAMFVLVASMSLIYDAMRDAGSSGAPPGVGIRCESLAFAF
jgi:hypothetical protein